MYCPEIKKTCVGSKCRDWDSKAGDCVIKGRREAEDQKITEALQFQREMVESYKIQDIWTKIAIHRLLEDPAISESEKQAIEQAMKTRTAAEAEKLLKDAGLID